MIEQSQSTIRRTEHAMLVAWGDFSRLHHLAERLRQEVFIPRHHENIPAGDLILEFGLLLLSGSTQLQDLNLGPRPLVKDEAVKEAWDVQFGHYTTVSRALKASTAETVAQVVSVLEEISRPFIDQEVQALAASGQKLVLHADLSGRPVSSYSQTYPEARWGHMGDTLALGHQHALITMQGLRYRLHLAGFLHPGDTVSQPCLRELIQATEGESHCRPRRRVELVMTQIEGLQNRLARYSTYLSRQQQALLKEQERQERLENQLANQRLLLATLEAKYGDKPIKPYSRLAKARQRQKTWRRQLGNSQQRQVTIQRKIAYHQGRIAKLSQRRDDLSRWYAELQADNATNPNPVRIRINLDGGFSGGDNLTYLIEMGYDPLAVGNGQSAEALLREQAADAVWTAVTPHVGLWEGKPAPVGECPYPLRRILQCWQAGDKSRRSIFLQYQDAAWLPLAEVFPTYHQRQHAEAAIKQGKSVFGGRGVRIRSAAGLELLNQFAFVFWPNFVHWATDWLRPRVHNGNKPFEATLQTVKTQVRVAAQTPATVFTTSGSRVLAFSDEGPYPEVRLQLAGIYAFQLPLLLYSCEAPTRYLSSVPRQLLSPPNG
jgi:hypothetical protein